MGIPVYLAMTAADFCVCSTLPPHPAWLSCLFSPYGRGLSNIPKQLPPDSLLILSDRTPPRGHDPALIYTTLEAVITQLGCTGLLLDFERSGSEELAAIAAELTALPCPVAVSAAYAAPLDCPVFVPSVPPSEPLSSHIAPWAGREIWLEVGMQTQIITVAESGAVFRDCQTANTLPHKDHTLCCHYSMEVADTAVSFFLRRNLEDWKEFLAGSGATGITRAVGLYQELA